MLIGEATHGTHEFYRERARITRLLIDECNFTAVAVEADWPDAYRVNRYVMGQSHDPDAGSALSDFRRFPAWMWRNRDVLAFVDWMRARNDAHAHPATKARFYGLDLYSLRASIEAVIEYLDRVDPARRSGPASVTAVSIMSATRVRPMDTRSRTKARSPVRTRSSRSWSSCDADRMPTCGEMVGLPRTSCFSRSRTLAWCETRRSTTSRCTGPRSRHGICETGTWQAHSTRSSNTSIAGSGERGSWFGSTTHMTERQSQHFEARLADQFDVVIHLDRTRALEPLDRIALWDRGEPPETFPSGV